MVKIKIYKYKTNKSYICCVKYFIMAQIKKNSTYPLDTTINDNDKIIGSDYNNVYKTRNYLMKDIKNYVIANINNLVPEVSISLDNSVNPISHDALIQACLNTITITVTENQIYIYRFHIINDLLDLSQNVTIIYFWGLGKGTFVHPLLSDFRKITTTIPSTQDIESQPNTVTLELGIIATQNDFVTIINNYPTPINFNDPLFVYLVTFTQDNEIFYYKFIGSNGIYGLGLEQCVFEDFSLLINDVTSIGNDPLKEDVANKQNSLADDGTGVKYLTVDAVNNIVDYITPEQFGAIGDGVTDDTSAIQSALSSTSKKVVFKSGKTYLINGGLTSSISNRLIKVSGATIKLKDSAIEKGMLSVTGAYTSIIGGIWDGNKANGNTPATPTLMYENYNILINANNCNVLNITSINTSGIGIKGGAGISYMVCKNNTISNTELYGIFIDGNSTIQYGNKAIANTIDITENPLSGQGILFTSILPSGYQTDYEISSNKIIASSAATTENHICLAVRGNKGIFSKNITIGGSMGISEGGNETVYSDNIITDLAPTGIGYGIEIAGADLVVSGNIIKNSKFGIIGTNSIDYINILISNNNVDSSVNSVQIVVQSTYIGENIEVISNTLNGAGVYFGGNASNIFVSNNSIKGIGSGSGNNAIFLDNIEPVGDISIVGNKIIGFFSPYCVYSPTSVAYSNLIANSNNLSNDVPTGANGWRVEGSAIIGDNVVSSNNILENNTIKNILDQKNNIYVSLSDTYNDPNGLLSAGMGSFYYSKNDNGGAYYKFSGGGSSIGWRSIIDIKSDPSFSGTLTLSSSPTSSAGTYDVLTRNTASGEVEKVSSSTFAGVTTTISKVVSDSSAVTGTTATVNLYTVTIPANTFIVGDIITVRMGIKKTGSASVVSHRLGGALGAFYQTGDLSSDMERVFVVKSATSTTSNYSVSSSSASSTGGDGGGLNNNIDWTTSQNITIGLNNNDNADSSIITYYEITRRR